jgi:hypothetical protein
MEKKPTIEQLLMAVNKAIAAIKHLLIRGMGEDEGIADHFIMSEGKSFIETIMYSVNQIRADIKYMKLNNEEKDFLNELLDGITELSACIEYQKIVNEAIFKINAAAESALKNKSNHDQNKNSDQ